MSSHRVFVALLLSLAGTAALACGGDSPVSPDQHTTQPPKPVDSAANDVLSAKFALGPVQPEDSTVVSSTPVDQVDTVNNAITTTHWIEQQVHFSAKDNPEDFMQFDPNAGVLWPGNVVLGSTVAEGSPSEFPIAGHRQPVTVYLDVVSGDSSGVANHFSRTVANPSGSAVNDAMNSILAGYKGSGPAKFTYSAEAVYSASQIAYQLGFGYSGPAVTVDANFSFKNSQAKSRYTVRLTQEYFTMTIDPIFGLGGAWDSTVTAAQVAPFATPDSPVAYIGSVTYGRVYWLTYESTASEEDLEAAVNAAYDGGVASGNVDAATQYNDIMKNTTVTVTQIGGDATQGLATIARDYSAIRDFMTKGAQFSPSSPGAPISYKVRYLSDGTLMKLNSTMDYTVTEKIPAGSETDYTRSNFDVFISSYQSWGPISSSRGALRVKLIEINQSTGDERTLWTSPCNENCDGARDSWGITYVPWHQDDQDPVNLNWTIPTVQYENKPGYELAVECSAVNFETWADPQVGTDRHIYGFDSSSQTWTLANPPKTTGWCQATDPLNRITVGVNFTFKINGQAQ